MRGGGSPERRRELAEARLALTAPPPAPPSALPDSAQPALPDSARHDTARPDSALPASPERLRRVAESLDVPVRSLGLLEPDNLSVSADEFTLPDDSRPRRPMDAVLRGAGVPATPPPLRDALPLPRDALRPVPLPDDPPRSPPRRQPVTEEVRGTSFVPPQHHGSPTRQGSPSRRRAQSPREPARSLSPGEPRMKSESVSPVRMRLLSESALAKHLPSQLLAAVSRDVKRMGVKSERPKFFCAPRKHSDPCRDGPGGPSIPVPGI